MKTLIPWVAAIGVSGAIGTAAAVVMLRPPAETIIERQVREAAEINREGAFEYVYEHDTGYQELVEATVNAMMDKPAKYRPTPEQVARCRERMKETYRRSWERERHPSGDGSR